MSLPLFRLRPRPDAGQLGGGGPLQDPRAFERRRAITWSVRIPQAMSYYEAI